MENPVGEAPHLWLTIREIVAPINDLSAYQRRCGLPLEGSVANVKGRVGFQQNDATWGRHPLVPCSMARLNTPLRAFYNRALYHPFPTRPPLRCRGTLLSRGLGQQLLNQLCGFALQLCAACSCVRPGETGVNVFDQFVATNEESCWKAVEVLALRDLSVELIRSPGHQHIVRNLVLYLEYPQPRGIL